ncbi:MAG TPA: hypothetical protein VGB95_00035 [Chitinophagales bacterium]
MEKIYDFFFIAFIVGALLIIISIPTLIAFFIFRSLRKTKFKFIGIVLLVIAPIWTAFEVYTAIYPLDSFYFDEFETITYRKLPASAIIEKKDAGYSDMQGDYCSAALIQLSEKDYLKLLSELKNDKRFKVASEINVVSSEELRIVFNDLNWEQIATGFLKDSNYGNYYIGFLDDKKTIVISLCNF